MKKMYCKRCKSLNAVKIEKNYFTFYKCKQCGEYVLDGKTIEIPPLKSPLMPPLVPPGINMLIARKIKPLSPLGTKLNSKYANTRDIKLILKNRNKK